MYFIINYDSVTANLFNRPSVASDYFESGKRGKSTFVCDFRASAAILNFSWGSGGVVSPQRFFLILSCL